nr:MAG TPA: hypothetical protein [Caudoviricetes sp.]
MVSPKEFGGPGSLAPMAGVNRSLWDCMHRHGQIRCAPHTDGEPSAFRADGFRSRVVR